MSRYIDKDKLIERFKNRSIRGDCKFCNRFEECVKVNSRKGSHLNCWEMIDMPEADVVEVVRCKDCVFSREMDKYEKQFHLDSCISCTKLSTSYHSVIMDKNSYCSYSERKENEQ